MNKHEALLVLPPPEADEPSLPPSSIDLIRHLSAHAPALGEMQSGDLARLDRQWGPLMNKLGYPCTCNSSK